MSHYSWPAATPTPSLKTTPAPRPARSRRDEAVASKLPAPWRTPRPDNERGGERGPCPVSSSIVSLRTLNRLSDREPSGCRALDNGLVNSDLSPGEVDVRPPQCADLGPPS